MKRFLFCLVGWLCMVGAPVHAQESEVGEEEVSAQASEEGEEQLVLPMGDSHPFLAIDDDAFLAFFGITGWGLAHWGWFTEPHHFQDEGGFSRNSSTGGADKTGHFYMSYLLAEVMTARLKAQGYGSAEAGLWGAGAAMAVMTWLEVGDGTGPYGFSLEDLLADFLGVAVSWVRTQSPAVEGLIDFRMEYWPTPGALEGNDLAADYSGMRHLLAVKLSGVPYIDRTPLHLLDLHFGYYTRGWRTFDEEALKENPTRSLYAGVGVNLAEVLKGNVPKAVSVPFHYYQVPAVRFEVANKTWD